MIIEEKQRRKALVDQLALQVVSVELFGDKL
jgi:hypothetical protein